MRILIVEDDAMLAEGFAELLRDEGYAPSVAGDAASALVCAGDGVDLVLLDDRLPDRRGISIIGELKRLSADSEVIVMTASADLTTAIQAMSEGAFDYLTKPVMIERFLHTVARAKERVELRRRERELTRLLERSERTHRAIVENVEAAIFGLDEALIVRFANRTARRALGINEEALLGSDFESFLHRRSDQTRRQILDAIAQGRELALELESREGTVRFMLWRWAKAKQEGQHLAYGIGTDLTRVLELERQARTGEQLRAAGALTSGLAHEIKNPLNAAMLQLSLLSRELTRVASPDQRQALASPLEAARRALVRLDVLLEDFLAFARPREYARLPVRLAPLVQDAVLAVQQRGRELGTTVTAEIAMDSTITGDAEAIRQVVSNLVSNALESGAKTITVSLSLEDASAVISIEDDGTGIPPEIASRIYDPFFSTRSSGTGLGLSLTHKTVTAHGGTLGFSARTAGPGTTFRVRIPTAP